MAETLSEKQTNLNAALVLLSNLFQLCEALEPLYNLKVPLVITENMRSTYQSNLENPEYKVETLKSELLFAYKLLMVYATQQDFDNIDLQQFQQKIWERSFQSPSLQAVFPNSETATQVLDQILNNQAVLLIREEKKEEVIPAVVPPVSRDVYLGPSTGDTQTSNNCFLNCLLMSLFAFPSRYVINQLYRTVIQKTSFMNKSMKMCCTPQEKVQRDNILDNLITFPVTVEVQRFISEVEERDLVNRKDMAKHFREFYECLQIGETTNLTRINNIRNGIRQGLVNCGTLLDKEVETVTATSFGTDQDTLVFFEHLFSPPQNVFKKYVEYSNESFELCREHKYEHANSSIKNLVVFEDTYGPLSSYFNDTFLNVPGKSKGNFECNGKFYSTRNEVFEGLVGDFFAFTCSRKRNIRTQDAYGRTLRKSQYNDFSNRIEPDQVLVTSDKHELRLLAVIVNLINVHYVCYLLNTHSGEWMYFDGNALRHVGTYEQLLEQKKRVPIYDKQGKKLKDEMVSSVTNCATMYIYGIPYTNN